MQNNTSPRVLPEMDGIFGQTLYCPRRLDTSSPWGYWWLIGGPAFGGFGSMPTTPGYYSFRISVIYKIRASSDGGATWQCIDKNDGPYLTPIDNFPINQYFWICVVNQAPQIAPNQSLAVTRNQPISPYEIQLTEPLVRIPQTVEIVSGSLPPGLTLNYNSQTAGRVWSGDRHLPTGYLPTISGTPTQSGTWQATLKATNIVGSNQTSISITVSDPTPAPEITSSLTASGTVGVSFSYLISASNSPTSFAATGLPLGLTVNASTGLISGTPTGTGTFNITLSASNSGGTGSATLSLSILPPPPVITSNLSRSGTVGTLFSYQILASNNPTSYGATGLPAGLTVNTTTGLISGTPSAAGNSSVTISATNSGGTGGNTLTLNIAPIPVVDPPPVITSSLSVNAAVGFAYSYQITATYSPISYAATGLPPGLTLNTATGLISGTPSAAGNFNAVISATNTGGTGNATMTFSIAVGGTIQVQNYSLLVNGEILDPASDQSLKLLSEGTTKKLLNRTTAAQINGNLSDLPGESMGGDLIWLKEALRVTHSVSGFSPVIYDFAYFYSGDDWVVRRNRTTGQCVAVIFMGGGGKTGENSGFANSNTTDLVWGNHNIPWSYLLKPDSEYNTGLNIILWTGGINDGPTLPAPQPVITSPVAVSGTVGQEFSYQITASNNPTSFLATGLPPGLSFNFSEGLIYGTPTTAGTFNITISASNSTGTGSATLVFTCAPAPSRRVTFRLNMNVQLALKRFSTTESVQVRGTFNGWSGTLPMTDSDGNGEYVASTQIPGAEGSIIEFKFFTTGGLGWENILGNRSLTLGVGGTAQTTIIYFFNDLLSLPPVLMNDLELDDLYLGTLKVDQMYLGLNSIYFKT